MIVLVEAAIYIGGFLLEDLLDKEDGVMDLVVYIVFPIAAFISIISIAISLCYRRSLFRVIGCLGKIGSPTIPT